MAQDAAGSMRILDIPQILTDADDVWDMRAQLAATTAMVDALKSEVVRLQKELQQERERGDLYYRAFVDAERKTHGR